ncbi:uncharacterized protein BXIN_3067 [Babesia sp. Xinjiang]|uniref:uncharacterized protein n=1 Tax=Babesia sp. Xinjiang TaxID=462227 RepID=UPI000A22E091|nr:uncharacterized protein BXIN_3067 [Babesia sp. Xinjiang]ORM39355.1 hypothetical protein BXIN_3067 [Babesia sp. Xinjiang]
MRQWVLFFLLASLKAISPCLLASIRHPHVYTAQIAFLGSNCRSSGDRNHVISSRSQRSLSQTTNVGEGVPVYAVDGFADGRGSRSCLGNDVWPLLRPSCLQAVRHRASFPGVVDYPSLNISRNFALGSFFGSVNSVFTDAEYDHRLELNKKYDALTDETDDSGLPLAPAYEDYEVDDSTPAEDADLTRPPSSKEEWYLKRLARGRRFWHKYFAEPSQQSIRFYRLVKMKHDLKFCNRVVRREYIELRPEIKPREVDGKIQPLTRRERNKNRSRIQVVRTTVGYDNSSDDSNILILLTLPQERLVRMVERIRLPHLLALRNFEMLRLLRHSMLFMSKPNIFESTVDFLLTFSRLDTSYSGEIPQFCDLPTKPTKRFRPMIYAVIGRLRTDPFPDHLLKVRSSQPPPIRDPFPHCDSNKDSVLTRFLNACSSLVLERLRGVEYDFDAVMDRNFSDYFTEMMPNYTTKESVNRIDYPLTVSFSREMSPYLREPVESPESSTVSAVDQDSTIDKDTEVGDTSVSEDSSPSALVPRRGSTAPWTSDEVKLMLKRVYKLGLTKPSTLIDRFKRLHCDIGFSFEDILWLGRTRPQIFLFGNYKQRCQEIYDCDEDLTFEDVLSMVRRYPNLLSFNVLRSLRPKIYYLRRIMRREISDLVDFPKYLSFSLYDRIIPRHIALMNRAYRGEFLKVYRFLFESGFYKGYGQTVTDDRVPDILPSDHDKYLAVYEGLSREADLRSMLVTNDDQFLRQFNLSYRDLVQGKEDALRIPLPTDLL